MKKIAASLLVLVCTAVLFLFVYWFFDWTPPIRILHSEDVRTSDVGGNERREFRAGETIRMWRGVCVDRRVSVESTRRWLVDTKEVSLANEVWDDHIDETTPVGTCVSRWVAVKMPSDLTSLTWKYNYNRVYRLNPLRTASVHWPVFKLTIIPPRPEKKVEVLEHKVGVLEGKVDKAERAAAERAAAPARQGPPGPPGPPGVQGPSGTPTPATKPKMQWWWK